jgi:CelD/BcsL family acetyltransferase involved in cellulose biosynthesis
MIACELGWLSRHDNQARQPPVKTARIAHPLHLQTLHDPRELLAAAGAWNALAVAGGSPFLTAEWLSAWWNAFGSGQFTCLLLRDDRGGLRAGVCCRRLRGRLSATANAHTGDWDAVAADDDARRILWRTVAGVGAGSLHLAAIRSPDSLDAACLAARQAGYSVVTATDARSPYLELPTLWGELLASVSHNLRSQLGRRRRALEQAGQLRFRTTTGEERLDLDLEAFLQLEASGWKTRAGTAILSDPRTERLYREFARGAARAGWLRLHLLELDGVPIAGDFGCAFAGGTFLLKTAFDEQYGRMSPGLVLRGEVLRTAIEEGSGFYDFLGGPDGYKLRWATDVRPRLAMRAYRGPRRPLVVYHAGVRPLLKASVSRLRALRAEIGRRRGQDGRRQAS